MSIVPHATAFFDSLVMCLRRRLDYDRNTLDDWQLDAEEACVYLDRIGEFLKSADARELKALPSPTELRLVGAEPFSREKELDRILACSSRNGLICHLWTTAVWVRNRESIREMLEFCAGRARAISLYTTSSLLAEIGAAKIDLLLQEIHAADLTFSIVCAIGPHLPFPREILELAAVNHNSSVVQVAPSFDLIDGSDKPQPSDGYLLPEPPMHRRCAGKFGFHVLPGGEAFPCASGVGVPALCLGSLRDESVSTIMRRAADNAHLRRLRDCGPYYLYEAAKNSPEKSALQQGYVDACHFHRHALSHSTLSKIIATVEIAPPTK